MNASFYKELEGAFDNVPKYNMNILVDFDAKVGKEGILKGVIGNERFHALSSDNGVTVVNSAPHTKI
jgi:hypothetical protein